MIIQTIAAELSPVYEHTNLAVVSGRTTRKGSENALQKHDSIGIVATS